MLVRGVVAVLHYRRDMSSVRDCVYILQSESDPGRFYTGITSDPVARLSAHNSGLSCHTATGRPWRMTVHVQFADANRAAEFEAYLKSGSGRAFARRHFR